MSIADKLTTIAENEQKVYDKGVTDGKQSEYDAFWDNFQNYGNKPYTCMYMFAGGGWNSENFKPKYDIVIGGTSCTGMFQYFNTSKNNENPIDMIQVFKEQNIKFDGVFGWQDVFNNANISTLPTVSMSNLNKSFYCCSRLETIEKLILTKKPSSTSSAFSLCTSLKNIVIEGEIGISLSMSSSPLTVESAKSVINALTNYAGTTNELTYKLTLKSTVWTALNEAEAPPTGDTWKDYVTSLGWQCA